jgi:hypothetical protein
MLGLSTPSNTIAVLDYFYTLNLMRTYKKMLLKEMEKQEPQALPYLCLGVYQKSSLIPI